MASFGKRLAELRKAYHESGEKGYWSKVLGFYREASKQPRKFASTSTYGSCDYMKYLDVATVQVRLGQFNDAFESLERAYTKHEPELVFLTMDSTWDNMRSDSRFQDLICRVGLPN